MPPPSPTAVNTSVYAQSLISASLVFLLGGGGRAREEPARGVGTVHVSWGGGGVAVAGVQYTQIKKRHSCMRGG